MRKIIAILCCILINLSVSYAQNCNAYVFSRNQKYATCVTLPVLNSHLHWNYYTNNGTVDVAFRHTGSTTSQWVAWALNIDGWGMRGAQALVALTSSNGSVQAYTSAITGYGTGLQPSSLSFEVPMIRAERDNGDVVIYATLVLPSGKTTFNQVWQVGPVFNGHPGMHQMGSDNRNAVGFVDFTTGQISVDGSNAGGSWLHRKNTHGVLNVVSWGVAMPIGAIAARYLKAFTIANPLWFYIHSICQAAAFVVGVAGFVTGIKLGSDSTGITHTSHRNMGITLFILGILQVLALFFRPNPDSKYRFYWNIYHRGCGYSTLILSIIQVYSGLDILDPEKKWKHTYTDILIALGVLTVLLEASSWFIFLKRKEEKKTHAGTNGGYGANEQV